MAQTPLFIALSLGLSALIASPLVAQGARNCGPRDTVMIQLAERFGETRQAMGLGANNAVIEVFASRDSGTWTITATLPNGLTCMIASGQAFEPLAEVLAAKGNDT